MKNKNKLLIGIILIVAAIGVTYFSSEITGYFIGTTPDTPDGIPDTDNRIIYSPVQAVETQPGSKEYNLVQKYRVGKDDFCVKDCMLNCTIDRLEFYKAYVQRYGYCMCKCWPAS